MLGERHRMENIHSAIFVHPALPLGRQAETEFTRETGGNIFGQRMFCPRLVFDKSKIQLFA